MSKNKDEAEVKSEDITNEPEIKQPVGPNVPKRIQTAEGWKRSVKRMRKSSKTTSKS